MIRKTTSAGLVGLTLLCLGATDNAHADSNLLGFYAGASVGDASFDETVFDYYDLSPIRFNGSQLGWGATLGIRPISFLGAEIEYIDFGTTRTEAGPAYNYGAGTLQVLGGSIRNQAAAAFAVGYLPLPVPWIEPYAKVGVAHVWAHYSYAGIYEPFHLGQTLTTQSYNKDAMAYGGGLAFPFGSLTVRAEYELINVRQSGGNASPSLLSLGATWSF